LIGFFFFGKEGDQGQLNDVCKTSGNNWNVGVYNTNGFRIEIIYDYYITMKFMFLVVKLSSHPSIDYASLPFFYHELHTNNIKTIQNQKAFEIKISILTNFVFIP